VSHPTDEGGLTPEQLKVARSWSMSVLFPNGQRVRYIPTHAHGDPGHPDCEDGIVTRTNHRFVFVRYGGRDHSIATDPEDLVKL